MENTEPMDKYHIYEEIGKGDFSQVFKGREKKKIEYVAIKRIEKSAMSKVFCICFYFVTGSKPNFVDCERGSSNAQTK